jgi:predicted enzyme related to lactoylglutathione lyase
MTSFSTTPKEIAMPALETVTVGAPCWADLMTSDTEGSRAFYGQLFGWTAEDPNPEFAGYFNFRKDGALVAGCFTRQPGTPMDVWSVYLATDDAKRTVEATAGNGGQVLIDAMAVGELGTMAVLSDSGGAVIGLWQPGLHKGFGVVGEPGAPAWFELHTRDYPAAVGFYRDVFRWDTHTMSDTPEFRYTTLGEGEASKAGIMDATAFLPDGAPAHWSIYFAVDDTDAAVAKVVELGGSVVGPALDTPYGRLAAVADPTGARFKVLGPNTDTPAS